MICFFFYYTKRGDVVGAECGGNEDDVLMSRTGAHAAQPKILPFPSSNMLACVLVFQA